MTSTQPRDTAPGTTGADDRARPAPAGTLPLALTHAQMNAAYHAGEAIPLAAAGSWLIRYRDAWWVVYERGWLRITDTATTEDLDQAAARITQAESLAAHDVPATETLTRSRVSE